MDTDSHIYGLLGRIHVLMRRTVNRITDVEYMRVNPDYAREIVRIAEAAGQAELSELCAKLRVAMELDPPSKPGSGGDTPEHHEKKPLFSHLIPHHKPDEDDDADKYVGTLR